MALHPNSSSMAVAAIEEYLEASANCLSTVKPDGGCLGYPAALLQFCVANALGCYLCGDDVRIDGRTQKITKGEPFRVLNHSTFGLTLSGAQIKLLEQSYRNTLAHNAIIEVGCFMVHTPEDPPVNPFTFARSQVQAIDVINVYVDSFQILLVKAWAKFPRERIQIWAQQRPKPRLKK
jgi:hypothetical protein